MQTMIKTPSHSANYSSQTQAQALVQFDHVKKSYDGIHYVVQDLSFSVGRGEFLTMLGPSGSGKTTSLMMLGGFERPTLGRILLNDRPVENLPPEKRNIGFVFQNYALFPHMTVEENVAFPLRYRDIKGAAAADKVRKALERVRLEDYSNRKPQQLSGGQQQRVALARALVFEPSLVLMDEPLGALDKQLREKMQIEIKHLQQSLGITMVYVTHDQSEALTMSDRIAVFHQGVVQQLADPETLYKRPANRFVADFIGENNLVPVQISSVSSGVASVCASDGTQLYVPIEQGMIVELGSAYLAIRPECLYVRKNLENNNNNNIFQGVIAETFFLGDHVRLVVNALGESMTTRLTAQHAGQFRIGDRIELYCAHNDTQLLLS